MIDLKGKRALVTGGSRGIGAAIALALAERGADVALTFQNSTDRARAVVASIEAHGRRGIAIQADSADPTAIRGAVDEAAKELGGLDILVNNAAIALYGAIADIKVEDIDALLAVNVRGTILSTQAALPYLGAGGRVITIGSAGADRIVGATGTVYFMTKSALQSFTRGLAQELGPRDITANLIQPGSTDTEMNPADGEYSEFQRNLIPLGRYGAPSDIATAVTFLASPAARQVTGVTLNVDGGLNT